MRDSAPVKPIDRGALLGARGEVDAAQERRHGRAATPPNAVCDEALEHGFERGELRREAGDARALLGSALGLQALEHALLQALQQAGELAGERPGMALWRRIGRERHAPDLAAGLPVEVVEEFGEADDQVDLGHEEVDREPLPELLLELADAPADGAGVRLRARPHRARLSMSRAERDDDAVERLAGTLAAQQVEEALPAGLVGAGIAVLRRVAAGGIDEHGLLGEPPVAVARAAHAGDRAPRGEREVAAPNSAAPSSCPSPAGR